MFYITIMKQDMLLNTNDTVNTDNMYASYTMYARWVILVYGLFYLSLGQFYNVKILYGILETNHTIYKIVFLSSIKNNYQDLHDLSHIKTYHHGNTKQ